MGVREKLNQNKAFGVVAAVVMAGAAIAFAAYNLRGTGSPSAYEAYYTTDDGQTFFGGTVADVPPFQKDGKEAVRAHVYTCNGKPFVNHLERYTPEARKVIAAAMATPDTPPLPAAGTSPASKRSKSCVHAWASSAQASHAARFTSSPELARSSTKRRAPRHSAIPAPARAATA